MAFFSDKFRRLVTTYHCASVDVGTEADCKGNPRLLSSTPQSCDDGFFSRHRRRKCINSHHWAKRFACGSEGRE
jgi:hypothetical protein